MRTPSSSHCDRRAGRVTERATEAQAARGVPFSMKTEGGCVRSLFTQGDALRGDKELLAAAGDGTWRGGKEGVEAFSCALYVSSVRKAKACPAGFSKG